MKKFLPPLLLIVIVTGLGWRISLAHFPFLQPEGLIASQERQLLLIGIGLASIVVIPIFGFAAWVAWNYRDGKEEAEYKPNWDSNHTFSAAWWVLLGGAIATLAVVTWNSTHALDPQKVLAAPNPSGSLLTVQVIALQWKWLFIYPSQKVATVNYVAIPSQTPVTFEMTAQAPMNSFWIPQLGGQMYAMEGMMTRLNLMANRTGTYQGSSVEISGTHFADMRFKVQAMTDQEFHQWVTSAQQQTATLDWQQYQQLARPATAEVATYGQVDTDLFAKIMGQFMAPSSQIDNATGAMPGMAM